MGQQVDFKKIFILIIVLSVIIHTYVKMNNELLTKFICNEPYYTTTPRHQNKKNCKYIKYFKLKVQVFVF